MQPQGEETLALAWFIWFFPPKLALLIMHLSTSKENDTLHFNPQN
jgi:hypothetical protein